MSEAPWATPKTALRVEPLTFTRRTSVPANAETPAGDGKSGRGPTPVPAGSSEHWSARAREEAERAKRAQELQHAVQEAEAAGFRRGDAAGWQRGKAEGLKEGDAAGYARGKAESDRYVEAARNELGRMLGQLEEHGRRLARGHAEAVAGLAVRVAAHIVGMQRVHTPQLLLQAATEAASRLPLESSLELRLHPDDRLRISALPGAEEQDGPRLSLVADSTLSPGDFVLESDLGGVDGRISGQLDVILERLLENVESWGLESDDPDVPPAGQAEEAADGAGVVPAAGQGADHAALG